MPVISLCGRTCMLVCLCVQEILQVWIDHNQFELSFKSFQFLLQLINNISLVFLINRMDQHAIAHETNTVYDLLL